MPFVFGAVPQQITVELEQDPLGERHVCIMREDQFHHIRISCNLLLITTSKRLRLQSAQQFSHLGIRHFRSLNSGGRSHAFNRGQSPKAGKPVRGQTADSAPMSLVTIHFADGAKDFTGNRNCDWELGVHRRLHLFLHCFASDYI